MNDNLDVVFSILNQIRDFDENQKRVFYLCFDEVADFKAWRKDIPYIAWPAEWMVKFYPTIGALLRGVVRLKSDPTRQVSFYFDGYSYLGYMCTVEGKPIPYWEIYNISCSIGAELDCGPERFYMNEIDKLLEGIRKMLSGES